MSLRAVVLGLDGVLVSRQRVLVRAYQQALGQTQGRYYDPADVVPFLDIPERWALQGSLGAARGQVALHTFTEYVEHHLREVQPLPGAASMVWHLRHEGYALALVAPSGRRLGGQMLRGLGIGEALDVILFAEDIPLPPPDPSALEMISARLGSASGQTVVLSARGSLLEAAAMAGMTGLAAGWDPDEKAALDASVARVASPEAFMAWLATAQASRSAS